jgi:hypothetical protein
VSGQVWPFPPRSLYECVAHVTRKHALGQLLRKAPWAFHLNEHFAEPGDIVFRHACKLGFEGIVSKQLGSPYRSDRSRHWIEAKNPAGPAASARPRRIGESSNGREAGDGLGGLGRAAWRAGDLDDARLVPPCFRRLARAGATLRRRESSSAGLSTCTRDSSHEAQTHDGLRA